MKDESDQHLIEQYYRQYPPQKRGSKEKRKPIDKRRLLADTGEAFVAIVPLMIILAGAIVIVSATLLCLATVVPELLLGIVLFLGSAGIVSLAMAYRKQRGL